MKNSLKTCRAERSPDWASWGVAALAFALAVPEPAQAYLDPATGSMIIQAAVAAALGTTLVVKTRWRRLKGFFTSKPKAAAQKNSDSAPDGNG